MIKHFIPIRVISRTRYYRLKRSHEELKQAKLDIAFLTALADQRGAEFARYKSKAISFNAQDLFVLSELRFKMNGYFVDFGATDGVSGSNTYILENDFRWNGILAEPARCWHRELKKNRKAHIEELCVWNKTGDTIMFNEVQEANLSTVDSFSGLDDGHKKYRAKGTRYPVKTISLTDLLKKYDAPRHIDYLSIDTEGSEFEILKAFDFDSYRFSIITCEHNHIPERRKNVYDLLTSKGYKRKFENISDIDDWYVAE